MEKKEESKREIEFTCNAHSTSFFYASMQLPEILFPKFLHMDQFEAIPLNAVKQFTTINSTSHHSHYVTQETKKKRIH